MSVRNTYHEEVAWWHEASCVWGLEGPYWVPVPPLTSCITLNSISLAENICWGLGMHIAQLQSAMELQEEGRAWCPSSSCSLNRSNETKHQMTTSFLCVGTIMDEGESMTVNICPARLIRGRDLWFFSVQFEFKALMGFLLYFRKQVNNCTCAPSPALLLLPSQPPLC